jgi:hypothetical protein
VPAPADLIAQEKFVDVMVDVRLLEGAYSARVAKPDTIKPYMNAYYNNLFTKHGISKEQFKTSYAYYLQQENTMVNIEDAVIEKLNVLSAELGSNEENNSVNNKVSTNTTVKVDSITSAYKKPQ